MRAEQVKGLMEAYSKVHETSEVLNEEVVEEDVEQLMERGAPTDPKARAAYDAQVAKNRAALGNTLLYGNAAGKKPEAPVTRNRNTRGGGVIKPPTKPAAAAPAKPGTPAAPAKPGTPAAPAKPAGQTVAAAGGKGGTVTVGTKYAATLGGQKGNVSYDAAGKKTFTATSAAPTKPAAAAPTKPAATSAAPKPTTPAAPQKPQGSAMDQWAKANPKLAAAKAERDRTRGTSATTNPLMKDMKANLPAPKSPSPSTASTAFGLAKKGVNLATSLDIFDIVKGHLLDEGYAETEDAAMVIMVNMSEEWRKSILEAHGVQLDEIAPLVLGGAAALGAGMAIKKGIDSINSGKTAAQKGTKVKNPGTGLAGAAYGLQKRKQAMDDAMKDLRNSYEPKGEEIGEAQEARENPEKHEENEKKEHEKKYGHVRGEKTPMPPRGDKRREAFEKWYAKQGR